MYYLSQMCEYLLGLDENLLLLVNGYHTPFLDKVMWTIFRKKYDRLFVAPDIDARAIGLSARIII